MRVIFIKDLRGHGKIGEIKEVKDGYGKNFLIKNKYAVLVTEKSVEKLHIDNDIKKQKDKEDFDMANEIKTKLEALKLQFKVKTGKQDKVFGSISSKQVAEELEKEGFKIDKRNIILDSPISTLGYHQIEIELYKGISANLKVELIK